MTYDNQSQELNLEELNNVSGAWCGNDIKFRFPKFPFPFPFPFPGPGPTFPGPGPTFPDMPIDLSDGLINQRFENIKASPTQFHRNSLF